MRYYELFENKINLSRKAQQWIQLWSSGESRGIRSLTPEILQELSKTIEPRKYKLFRSWKFDDEEEFQQYFGVQFESIKRGNTLQFTNNTPTSWTKSGDIAKKFFDPRYDAINSVYFDDEEIEEMGYEYGDTLKISIRALGIFESKDLILDFDNIRNGSSMYNDEREVIVKGGQYSIRVLDAKEHLFQQKRQPEQPPQPPEQSEMEKQIDTDYENIDRIKDSLPDTLDEIKMTSISDTLTAIGWIFKYGPHPKLLSFVNSANLNKNTKIPLRMAIGAVQANAMNYPKY